ncbi:MAG: hypothetical protein PHQ34_04610 [Methanothrix sp.]|nr:hypothetical protein [Methanothrix sp.]
MAEGSRKALRRFVVLILFLHNINNNNVIIIVFNSFDIHILLWLTEQRWTARPDAGHESRYIEPEETLGCIHA